jgi:adenylate cyclase
MEQTGQDRAERRLAAILAADVAGYSRLMGIDEEDTLARLKDHRRAFVDPKVAEHRGRIVKTTGDGILIEFPSVVEAVECAVAIQRGMGERNKDVPVERRIEFRVGVNLGDIILEDGDIFGDGVNIAARLENLAEPGGVLVTRTVRNQVRDKLPFHFDDMGEHEVKNIARPLRVFRVRVDDKPADELTAARAVLARPAIAVLPFQNMSGDPEQEYFADGITEEIITALARFREFPVIARNSAFVFKGRAVDVMKAAKELGVRYVLEGSVRKAGARVRITAQLIDGANGHHLWAERYDRDLADIFAVQDEITERVASEIAPAVRLAETQRSARKPPDSLDAWDHYLLGLLHANRHTPSDNEVARREFGLALRLAPDFAAAHTGLAWVEISVGLHVWTAYAEAFQRALVHARRAVASDEGDALAHCALGYTLSFLGDRTASIETGKRAVALNPNYPRAWQALGTALIFVGDARDALEPLRRAIALARHEPWLWHAHVNLAYALYIAGDYDAALDHANKSRMLNADAPRTHAYAAAALAQLGRRAEAAAELAELQRRWPDFGARYFEHLRLPPEHRAALFDGLRKAGLQ